MIDETPHTDVIAVTLRESFAAATVNVL